MARTSPWGRNSAIDLYSITLDRGALYGARAEGFYDQFPPAIQAYDALDGSVLWTNTGFFGATSESGGVVYVNDYQLSAMYVLDARHGRPLWHTDTGSTSGVPVISHGFVYLGTPTGFYYPGGGPLVAIDLATHQVAWTAAGKGLVGTMGSELILAASNSIEAVAGDSGDVLWRVTVPKINQALILNGVLWITEDGVDGLFAFDPKTGQLLRTFSSNTDYARPMVGDGRLYIIDHKRVRMYS